MGGRESLPDILLHVNAALPPLHNFHRLAIVIIYYLNLVTVLGAVITLRLHCDVAGYHHAALIVFQDRPI